MAPLLVAILLGGLAQRATGMGLILVSAPFIVVVLGPAQGVVVGSLLGLVASLMVLTRVHRSVEWQALRVMLPTAVVGVAAGTLLAEMLPTAWTQILIGILILAALAVSSFVARARQVERSTRVMAVAGATSGATSALAGVGGPSMAVLRTLTRWEHASFTATLQPFFIGLSVITVVARVTANPNAWPDLGWSWVAIGLAMTAGVVAGDLVTRRLPAHVIGTGITVVASLGAVWTVVDGVAAL